jgi:hypothetical protein
MCKDTVKASCIEGFCHAFILGKGCKKGDNCKWKHPTAHQIFKQLKKHGVVDVDMMRCHKTPFCLKLIVGNKCKFGNNCCLGHSISAASLIYWLKKKECLTIEL